MFADILDDKLCDAIVSRENWANVLETVRSNLTATSVGLMDSGPVATSYISCTPGTSAATLNAYEQHYFRLDPLMPALPNTRVMQLRSLRRVCPDEADLEGPFMHEWAIPNGMGNALFTVLERDGGRYSWICAAYPHDLDAEELRNHARQFRSYLAKIRRTLKTAARIDAMNVKMSTLAAMGDDMLFPVLRIDQHLRVIAANRLGSSLAIETDGIGIVRGHLACRDADATCRLNAMVQAIADGSAYEGVMLLQGERDRYTIDCWPVEVWESSAQFQLTIRRARPAGYADGRALAQNYGLTQAETRVALSIASGAGLVRTAQDLSVSISTVRIHLQRVFEKVDVHSQAALSALIQTSRSITGQE